MDMLRAVIGPDEGHQSWQQLCMRAVLIFVFGVICVRVAGRRTFSNTTPLDIVVALIVGSNLSRVMTGKAAVVPALSATLVLVALHRILAMCTLRWNGLSYWLKGRPAVLVRDGEVDVPLMRRHGLSRGDLLEGLRLEQAETPDDVRLATLEGGGKISVVRKSGG